MNSLEKAKEINAWVVKLRRDFHMHPEPSNEEVRTAKIVEENLRNMGIKVKRIGKTGILGELAGAVPGKVIALRADMDALSVTEETGLPYSSQVPGFMHACGHDIHTAMLLGAAKILSGMKEELKGTVKFIFQPAEEVAEGAKTMVEGGVLENPAVDMAYAMHVMPDVPVGKVVIQDGFFMASGDSWSLTVKGKSCHGSSPWQGVDALTCTTAIIQSLQTIVSRVNDARAPIVINVGTIHGGERFNVIPGKVEIQGMNRAFSENSRKQLPEWMENIIKSTCDAYKCSYEFKYNFVCSPMINENNSTMLVNDSVRKIVGKENIIQIEKMMGSEDFSEYVAKVPGMLMVLGGRNEAKDCCYSNHANNFKIDEDCIPIGVASYVQVAADYLATKDSY